MAQAKTLVSPGILFIESDQSNVPAVALNRSVGVIGLANRGPAFKPTICLNWDDFKAKFGERNINYHGPYASYYTFKKYAPVTYVRVLGLDAYTPTDSTRRYGFTVANAYGICFTGSTGTGKVGAIVHTLGTMTVCSGTSRNFGIAIQNYNSGNVLSVSLYRGDKNFIGRVLNSDPAAYLASPYDGVSSKQHYIFRDFTFDSGVMSGGSVTCSLLSSGAVNANDYTYGYTTAHSPWIQSQDYSENPSVAQRWSLFQVHALSDGDFENNNIKFSIENIRNSPNTGSTLYGTFDLVVRKFTDTDKAPVLLERYTDLTLDQNSTNYIGARIGTTSYTWNTTLKKVIESGDFPQRSSYIRILEHSDLKNGLVPADAVPWGFDNSIPAFSSSMTIKTPNCTASVPTIPLVADLTWKTEYDQRMYWGFNSFNTASGVYGYYDDRLKFIPSSAGVTYDPAFSLDFLSSSTGVSGSFASASYEAVYYIASTKGNLSQSVVQGTTIAKFTVPLFGGFDGLNIHLNNPIDNLKAAGGVTTKWNDAVDWNKSYEINSLRNAIDTLSNPDTTDIKDLAIPGVYHPGVLGYAIQTVEDRGDTFLVCDISGSTVSASVQWRQNNFTYDSSYAACYFPRLKIKDDYNNKYVWVHPSVLMMGVLGYTDTIAYPWYAPAGHARGDISADVKSLELETDTTDRNTLYTNQINPIAKREGSFVVWGQKTLQYQASALDRINVRRLLIHIKKAFSGFSKFLIFENINQNLYDQFLRQARPFLARIVQNNGLNGFKLTMDASNNTPETRANNEVHAKLELEPTPTGEKFIFDLVVTKQGTFGV